MTLSFYHLFNSYAKHTQRYFSTASTDPYDYSELTKSFHEILVYALRDHVDFLRDNQATSADLNAAQISGLISTLCTAYEEALAESELNHEIYSCINPGYFMSLRPELVKEKRAEFQKYLDLCCPVNEDSDC